MSTAAIPVANRVANRVGLANKAFQYLFSGTKTRHIACTGCPGDCTVCYGECLRYMNDRKSRPQRIIVIPK